MKAKASKTQQNPSLDMSEFQGVFEKAYGLMNEPIIDGNCGELCGYHCCRQNDDNGERLGMYLLPLEFECIQKKNTCKYALHSHHLYDMPPRVKKLYYIFCQEADGCLRDQRPIQCRTYPFEPHFENEQLTLVIEKDQLHGCPLLDDVSKWRPAFIEGIFQGWRELIKIPIVKYYIAYDSKNRRDAQNIAKQHDGKNWLD